MEKEGAVLREGVDRRGLGNGVTIATEGGRLVIGDEENNISIGREPEGMKE